MALIQSRYLNCVVAIGSSTGKTDCSWIGTGFLFGYNDVKEESDEGEYYVHLITNKHVVGGRKEIYLLFNPEGDEAAKKYKIDLYENGVPIYKSHPDEKVDVSAVPLSMDYYRQLQADQVNLTAFRYDKDSYTIAEMKSLGVTEGDGVFTLGFPLGLVGESRNYTILRMGAIARINDLLEGSSTDFIIDSLVFPGNSGGPVVLKPEIMFIKGSQHNTQSRLIGMVKSSITYRDIALSQQTQRARIVFEENTGLTNVEPVDHIIEVVKLDKTK
jgi:hypothetical protein